MPPWEARTMAPKIFLEIVFYIYFLIFLINQMHPYSLFKILGMSLRLCLKLFNLEKNFPGNLFIGVGPSGLIWIPISSTNWLKYSHKVSHWISSLSTSIWSVPEIPTGSDILPVSGPRECSNRKVFKTVHTTWLVATVNQLYIKGCEYK